LAECGHVPKKERGEVGLLLLVFLFLIGPINPASVVTFCTSVLFWVPRGSDSGDVIQSKGWLDWSLWGGAWVHILRTQSLIRG
jgi:hypothetical protein